MHAMIAYPTMFDRRPSAGRPSMISENARRRRTGVYLPAAANPRCEPSEVLGNDWPPANLDRSAPPMASVQAGAVGRGASTAAQAQSAIERAGFSNVSGLAKAGDGSWSGTATKAGQTVNVRLDNQGNVAEV